MGVFHLAHEQQKYSFGDWFFSKKEILEKTVGSIILILEIINTFSEAFHIEGELLTHVLNLFFLVFIFIVFKRELKKRFSLEDYNHDTEKILRIDKALKKEEKLNDLIYKSNIFVSQLRNINYFVLCETALYLFLLIQMYLTHIYHDERQHQTLIALLRLPENDFQTFCVELKRAFHMVIDGTSYLGAFFLLRCFFVMYLPTVDSEGKDILNQKTNVYFGILIALMFFDLFMMPSHHGFFITEFTCGIINAVVFILFIARFENKILDIPPFILCILYLYAVMQTCLPFVTGNLMHGEALAGDEFRQFSEKLTGIVLTFCLVGKVTLSAVLLYVFSSRRIFYYFITIHLLHEEEEFNWVRLKPLIREIEAEPEHFTIRYYYNKNQTYSASMPGLFDSIEGVGKTPEEAKDKLIKKIHGSN
jgi:hypothetical protein